MISQNHHHKHGGVGTRVLRAMAILLPLLSVLWFLHWTVESSRAGLVVSGQRNDYYNLLVDGFQEGHLYMKADPDPRLLALPPDQRPGSAPFMLDASLYQDRYYLYFGVVPVVTLYWPYAALTGHDMPEGLAALIFAGVALGFSVWWWRDVRKHFFPSLSPWWDVVSVLTLGLCTLLPSTLRRPMFYEVAILAGWAFGVIGLWALLRAWLATRRSAAWLVCAGGAMGLAIGSRPNLAPAALLTLVVGCGCVALKPTGGSGFPWRRWLVLLCFAAAGAAPVGLGLAGYNYARFGKITEFGHTYQMGVKPEKLFHATNLWHNLRIYYFAPPQVDAYFPFVAPAEEPPKPVDYVGREQAHGEWLWSFLVGFAAIMAGWGWWRRRREVGAAMLLVAPVLAWFAINLLVTGLTGVRANRYMVDFHPALVLGTLFVLGWGLSAESWLVRAGRVVTGAALLIVAVFNVLASMQVHGWFAKTAPASFQKLSTVADGFAWRIAPWAFSSVGDQELELQWPATGVGGRWPLVSAGPSGFDDGIWITTDGAGRTRFTYQHWEYGATDGPWFAMDPGQTVRVRLAGALLLPPSTHPWYGNRPDYEREALKRRLRVFVGEQLCFDRDVPSHNSGPGLTRWGEWRVSGGELQRCPGVLGRARPGPVDAGWLAGMSDRRGVVRLRVKLPIDRFGVVEPLVQTGRYPNCDVLMVRFTRPGFVQLFHDRFGVGGHESEEFAVDYAQWQTIEFQSPVAHDGVAWDERGVKFMDPVEKLQVRWNGREVLTSSLVPNQAREADTVLGANLVGASLSRPLFGGQLEVAPFLSPFAPVGGDPLDYELDPEVTLVGIQGVLIFWQRPGRAAVGVVWRRASPEAAAYLGWFDEGRITWATRPLVSGRTSLRIQLPRTGAEAVVALGVPETRGLVQVEQGGHHVLSAPTLYFEEGPTPGWALDARRWAGLFSANAVSKPAPEELPGGISIRFTRPRGETTGADPMICAGVTGAADGIYLRSTGSGHYVLGLDHWGGASVESAPFELAEGQVYDLEVELGSFFPAGRVPSDRVRLRLDGQVMLDAQSGLHPVKPDQIMVGRNTQGMSTSVPVFRGAIYSVRTGLSPTK